jgi:short subunit fatty acids transporter
MKPDQIQKLAKYGSAGVLIADMLAVVALVKIWSGWGDGKISPQDENIFRWGTIILFIISIIIVPFVYRELKTTDETPVRVQKKLAVRVKRGSKRK